MRRTLLLLPLSGLIACGKPATTPQPVARRHAPPPPTHRPAPRVEASSPQEVPPPPVSGNFSEKGDASYYGTEFAGRATASGELFDPAQMTAAHRTLPLGTKLEVTNLDSGQAVIVRVNDRGPFLKGRILDCSTACAEALGYAAQGTARVGLRVIELGAGKKAPPRSVLNPPRPRPVSASVPASAPASVPASAPIPPPPVAPADSFAIQVGAYANRANAEAARARYAARGIPCYLQESGSVARVRLGPFADEAAARAAQAKLGGEGLVVREDGP